MTYKAFLIKYAEIAIKGKNRYLFEDALVSQMNHALKKVDGTFHIRKEQGRIYVEMEGEYDYDGAVDKSGGARIITYNALVTEQEGKVYLLLIYDKADASSVKMNVVKQIVKELIG